MAFGGLCAGYAGLHGNLSAAPLFLGETDYRLQPTSPGVDDGDDALPSEPNDLAGMLRIADGDGDGVPTVDIGAYESTSPDSIFHDSFESRL